MNAVADQTRLSESIGEAFQTEELSDFERLLSKQTNARDLLLDDRTFDRIYKIAEMMADGKNTVPKHLQGALADCIAVVTQAFEWGMNPHAVAQKTHVVNGALGYEAQLVNAVVQRSGAIRGHFHYEYRGEAKSLDCRAGAVLRGDRDVTWGEWLNVEAPKVKNSPLWQTNPRQQLGYLQVKNWARAYAPGAILGVYTPDELEDRDPPEMGAPKGPRRKSEAAKPTEHVDGDGVITGGEKAAATPAPGPASTKAASTPAASPAQPAGNAQGGIGGNQVAYLHNKLKAAGISEQSICDRFQAASIELLTAEQFDELKAELLANS